MRRFGSVMVAFALIATSCGGGGGEAEPTPSSVLARSPDGVVTVSSPAAVSADITIAAVTDLSPALAATEADGFQVFEYDFGPSGSTFDEPLTVAFTFAPEDLDLPAGSLPLALLVTETDDGGFEAVEEIDIATTEDAVVVSGPVDHFSSIAVVVGKLTVEMTPSSFGIGVGETVNVTVTGTDFAAETPNPLTIEYEFFATAPYIVIPFGPRRGEMRMGPLVDPSTDALMECEVETPPATLVEYGAEISYSVAEVVDNPVARHFGVVGLSRLKAIKGTITGLAICDPETTTTSGTASEGDGDQFGAALKGLVEADPEAFALLESIAETILAFDLPWTGSLESAFELFNLRRVGDRTTHPQGSGTATQMGPTDIAKTIGLRFPMGEQAVHDAFNQSDFPCGEGEIATTVCVEGGPDVPAGEMVMVGATFEAPVPLDSEDRSFLYLVGFDDGDPDNNQVEPGTAGAYGIGTDRRYLLSYSPSAGWALDVEGVDGSVARFIVHGNSVVLMVPASELGADPAYRFATFENAGDSLDLANTSDWAGDTAPNIGAQLFPIVPVEPPSAYEASSSEDPGGDAGACPAALDVTGIRYLVRGRQARALLALADDPTGLVEGGGIGLDIELHFPDGVRFWSVTLTPSITRLTSDDPAIGENPTVFTPSEPLIDVLFDSALPSGSTLIFLTKDGDDASCDQAVIAVP